MLLALIIGADGYEAWQDYRSTVAQSERTQVALSRAVAEQTARIVRNRGGTFAETGAARLPPEELTAFYATISVAGNASIRLVRDDGVILAQYPANAATISDDAYLRGALRRFKNGEELAYRGLDGQKQLITLRQVENYPMVIEAAQPISSLLDSWKQQEASSAARTLTLVIFAGLLLAAFRSALQRHDRLELERRRLEREIKDGQKAEALGFLAASMAHDFNNVLGAIVGNGEITRMLVEDNPQAVASVDRLLAASERARQLVGRVLAFDPRRSVAYVPLAVEPVVAEVLELIRAALPQSIALHADEFESHGSILGDSTEVHQVVMNLCSNAVRAMPGGGRLEVKMESLEVDDSRDMTLGRLQAGHWLRLSIVDTGIGLAADRVTSIFEPFYTTQPAGQGTGIGLTVVRNIVKRMGGAIEVDTRLGSGTRMSVYWPLLEKIPVTARAQADLPTHGRGQAVLIVDDEPELVRLAEETVASLGYEAIGFTDARAALKAFKHSPVRFDAVLTDERMPALRGIALASAIHDLRSEVPIILVTGCREAATDLLAKQAGVTEILEKPLRARKLQAALARALG